MSKMKLADRIIEFLKKEPGNSCGEWGLAMGVFPDKWRDNPRSRGALVAHVRRACHDDSRIVVFHADITATDGGRWCAALNREFFP